LEVTDLAVDPEDVAAGAFVAFVVLLLAVYELFGLTSSVSALTVELAFWGATASWLIMYANCGGYEWNTAEGWHQAVFAVSWGIFAIIGLNLYGVVDFSVQQELANISPYATYAVVGLHSLSAYLVWKGGS
jgi:hypothetical protein